MKKLIIAMLLASSPALAQQPTIEELSANCSIQTGQALIAAGQTQKELIAAKKEIEKLKAELKSAPVPEKK